MLRLPVPGGLALPGGLGIVGVMIYIALQVFFSGTGELQCPMGFSPGVYLPVSTPCASGDQTICEIPCSSQRGISSASVVDAHPACLHVSVGGARPFCD
jgi:hypothetical protein